MFLVEFGEFAQECNRSIWPTCGNEVIEGALQAVWCLVEDDRARLTRERPKACGARCSFAWQEAFEHEPPGRKPADGKGRVHGRRPWHNFNRATCLGDGSHEELAGI